MAEPTIKISLPAYQELILRKIDTDVPITKQIDRLLGIEKKGRNNGKSKLFLKPRNTKQSR